MDTNIKSHSTCSDKTNKGSLLVLVISLFLAVLLFVKTEVVNRKAETIEAKFEDRIQRIESEMKNTVQKMVEEQLQSNMISKTTESGERNRVISAKDLNRKLANTKVRRSLMSSSNSSLSIDDVRREITKHISKLNPGSLCQPSEKVCVPGPPGKKGSRGSRGRRGPQGDKGKKGAQGIMGPPGRHGKQGIKGSRGIKGEKGEKGAAGPRGLKGLKGDPGESISLPQVNVSPSTQTVTENQTSTFYCSASGNPRPTMTWSKVNSSLKEGHIINGGRLQILRSTFNDSGNYMCTADNILGRDQETTKLVVEVGPKLINVPDRFVVIDEDAVASLTCEAFSHPPPVITWTRIVGALPNGRSSVNNGVLTIQDFTIADTGTYVCTASNKLGSVTAVTTLSIKRKPVSCQAVVSDNSRGTSGSYELQINSQNFQVLCDVTAKGKAWTLIARFSNNDGKNWMRDDGLWWYDQQVAVGTTANPSINADMISPAFWLVSGREFKFTRSDDSSHTPLLQTTGNCLAGQTFRSKITSYGDFRNGKVWSSDRCLGSCTVQYGGQYKSTDGFQQAECSGGIQNNNKIGFWCDWDGGDGSVMMIGGGGKECARADHGIGITEANEASFVHGSEQDFGHNYKPSQSYSINLWIQ